MLTVYPYISTICFTGQDDGSRAEVKENSLSLLTGQVQQHSISNTVGQSEQQASRWISGSNGVGLKKTDEDSKEEMEQEQCEIHIK